MDHWGRLSSFIFSQWLKAAHCSSKEPQSGQLFSSVFWVIICPFFHRSIIPTSSGWSPTYLFPACIWGQSSAAHNWIPSWKAHIYWGCYSIWYTVSNLITIKWAKKCSMKYQRHHQGFVSYLWKFMFSAVKVSAWQSLPPLSYSPEIHSSVNETDTIVFYWNCIWHMILLCQKFKEKQPLYQKNKHSSLWASSSPHRKCYSYALQT